MRGEGWGEGLREGLREGKRQKEEGKREADAARHFCLFPSSFCLHPAPLIRPAATFSPRCAKGEGSHQHPRLGPERVVPTRRGFDFSLSLHRMRGEGWGEGLREGLREGKRQKEEGKREADAARHFCLLPFAFCLHPAPLIRPAATFSLRPTRTASLPLPADPGRGEGESVRVSSVVRELSYFAASLPHPNPLPLGEGTAMHCTRTFQP